MAVRYLETLLKGTALDLEVIGTAPNGVKAIPEIAKLHPDFVFVDISMPVMDGLQMSEEVLKKDPAQKIFMLTAYRDFEYAKKSVRLGVTDYILKNELSEQVLEELIRKNAADLEQGKRRRHVILETNLRNFFLSDDASQQREEWFYQDKPLQRYVLVYIAPKPEIVLEHGERKYGKPVDCYAVESSVQEKGLVCRGFAEVLRNEYCGIFFAQQDAGSIEEESRWAAAKIMEQFGSDMPDHICLVSSPVSRFSMLQTIYARFRRKTKFLYTGVGRIYMESELPEEKPAPVSRLNGWASGWRRTLESGSREEADAMLDRRLQELRDNLDVWKYTEKIREICRTMEAVLREERFDPDILKMAAVYTDINVLETDLRRSLDRYFEEYHDRLGNQYSRYTLLAQEYIRDHYAQDVSVADIAEASGVSEGHLRRCFKKEMNVSIVNYLTEYRLGQAKKLMESGRGNIDDIWKKTGFTSGQYFSYVFKKKEGITPRDYMRMVNDVGNNQQNS